MKRWLFKLVLFLVLGAVVNVAVAWGCALTTNFSVGISATNLGRVEVVWPKYLDEANWPPPFPALGSRTVLEGAGVRVTDTQSGLGSLKDLRFPENHDLFLLRVTECGWPFRSVEFHVHDVSGPHAEARIGEAHAGAGWYRGLRPPGFVPVHGSRQQHRLPIRPIAGGFIINTLLYASLLWLLTLGPFTARRMIRRKRGRCIKCGYDLRHVEHKKCPECGEELSTKAKQ